MSIVCLSHIMRHSEATLGARLVLFVLAEHAHDDGTEAFPSVDTIVQRTRMSRKGVQGALRRLEADSMIHRDGYGLRGQTKWRLAMGGEVTSPREADGQRGRTSRPQGGEPRSPEPSIEPLDREPVISRAREAKAITYEGRTVSSEIVSSAEVLLAEFNDGAQRRLAAFKDSGRPSDHLRQIIGALLSNPDVSSSEWREGLRRVIAHPPGWVDGRALIIGDVFGPRAAAHTLAPPAAVVNGHRPTNGDLLRELQASKEAQAGRVPLGEDRLLGAG